MLINSINPEIAARSSDYERNYQLLELARKLSLLATLLVNIGLWFLTCFCLLKSKKQSYWWLPLAMLGPLGFVVLTMLSDNAPALGDLHQQLTRKLNITLRVVYELGFFLFVWVLAYQTIVLKRDLMIMYESATTGVSAAEIIERQNASGGMWAASEGMQEMYLVVLFYLLWLIGIYVAGRLFNFLVSPKKA